MQRRRCSRGARRPCACLEPRDELVQAQLLEALADRLELGRAELDEPAALAHESSVSRRPASPESRRRMISSIRARGGLVGQVRRRSSVRSGDPGDRGGRARLPSAKRTASVAGARARAPAAGDRLAGGVLDQRVAALERALAGRGRRARARSALERRAARSRTPAPAAARGLALEHERAAPRAARARRATPPARARAHLAQLLVQARARWRATCSAGARESRASAARALERPRGGRGARSRAARRAQRRARLGAVDGTAASAAWVGVEQLTAATSSISVRSVWWPTEAITGTAQQRDRAAQRLVAEREQVGERAAAARDDDHLDLRAAPPGPAARA